MYRMKTEATNVLPLVLLLTSLCLTSSSYGQERWFQIEVSVFSNERLADREEEVWAPGHALLDYPANLQNLRTLMDLLLSDALQTEPAPLLEAAQNNQPESPPSALELRLQRINATGPFPADGPPYYSFPDFARDPFLQLPASESDFQQTNRALNASAEHRLLFHGLWRQPMPDPGAETPVLISGGERYGNHRELEGSLSLHFNASRDRVVIDTDLWLTEFTTLAEPGNEWQLPPYPEPQSVRDETTDRYQARRIYHFQQSRDMRSNEFHYLDHPALGLVVTVFPYDVPEEIVPEETEIGAPP